MRILWTLPVLAVATLLGAVADVHAQSKSAPSAQMYESCRSQAISKQLAGEARVNAINQCLAKGTADPNVNTTQAMYEACRNDAIARSLSGEARARAINQCVSIATIEPAAGGTTYSYETCRAGAIAKGVRGEAFGQFISKCTSAR